MGRTLSSPITTNHSGPGSDRSEGVPRIPQSSNLTGASPSDCLMSDRGHPLGEFYPSADILTVYSTAPTDWATNLKKVKDELIARHLSPCWNADGTAQFCTHLSYEWISSCKALILSRPCVGLIWVDLGAMAVKGYSAFPKALTLLEPRLGWVGLNNYSKKILQSDRSDMYSDHRQWRIWWNIIFSCFN